MAPIKNLISRDDGQIWILVAINRRLTISPFWRIFSAKKFQRAHIPPFAGGISYPNILLREHCRLATKRDQSFCPFKDTSTQWYFWIMLGICGWDLGLLLSDLSSSVTTVFEDMQPKYPTTGGTPIIYAVHSFIDWWVNVCVRSHLRTHEPRVRQVSSADPKQQQSRPPKEAQLA